MSSSSPSLTTRQTECSRSKYTVPPRDSTERLPEAHSLTVQHLLKDHSQAGLDQSFAKPDQSHKKPKRRFVTLLQVGVFVFRGSMELKVRLSGEGECQDRRLQKTEAECDYVK
ncbi:unnamed protein product [Boreogadus saida]